MPVGADVPEFLSDRSRISGLSELSKAVVDLALIGFYYLLRVGEYTVKRSRNETKQTKQFKLEDCTFFKKNEEGQLRQLARNAHDDKIMTADSATLKLDNSKNGWKGVCVNQGTNREEHNCAVRALGRRYISIRRQSPGVKTFLSAYWAEGKRCDVNDEDMRTNLKWAAVELNYPTKKGIPEELVDTHSLRIGGANALSLSGYSDREIQKMGRWRGQTFKDYVREQIASFSEGMAKNMKRKFNFVNVCAGAHNGLVDIMNTMVMSPYDNPQVAAA